MSRKARVYSTWSRLYLGGWATCDALHTGLWLGLLDRLDLHAVDQATYVARPRYRSDVHNLGGLFGWEQRMLAEHFPGAGSLVVLGAGAGRELVALAARGYRVTGYECNPILVTAGKDLLTRQGFTGAQLTHLGRDLAPTGGGPYAGAIVGWCAYTLIAGRGRRVALLTGLRAALPPGAPLLVSFFSRPARQRRARLVTAVANGVRRISRHEPVERGDDLAPNFVHRFTEAELVGEFTEAGYEVVAFAGERSGAGEPGYAVARAN